jgi:DNA-binding NarL/FixJ family response regulator
VKNLKATHVLIADMPQILREMVCAIVASEPLFKIVGVVERDQDLASAIHSTRADVVIVAEPDDPLEQTRPSIHRLYPHLAKVIAISETGREAAHYQVRLDRRSLGEVSTSGLLELVRELGALP